MRERERKRREREGDGEKGSEKIRDFEHDGRIGNWKAKQNVDTGCSPVEGEGVLQHKEKETHECKKKKRK